MSYAEYLRRKASAAPVIIDTTPKKVDASFFTSQQKRMANSQVFYTSTRVGVVNNVNDPSSTTHHGPNKPSGNIKISGGRVPDASMFTAYVGGQAIGNEVKAGLAPSRLVTNYSDAGSISACRAITGPTPFTGGLFAANNVPMSAGSGYLNNTKHCDDTGRIEPHTANELGPPIFVDNMRPAAPAARSTDGSCKYVDHTHPVVSAHTPPPNRAIPTHVIPARSTDIRRKVGAATPNLRYVEAHHGNAVVNRPVYGRYKPSNAPARLKINDAVSSRPA
jgi:hypothetical protein